MTDPIRSKAAKEAWAKRARSRKVAHPVLGQPSAHTAAPPHVQRERQWNRPIEAAEEAKERAAERGGGKPKHLQLKPWAKTASGYHTTNDAGDKIALSKAGKKWQLTVNNHVVAELSGKQASFDHAEGVLSSYKTGFPKGYGH